MWCHERGVAVAPRPVSPRMLANKSRPSESAIGLGLRGPVEPPAAPEEDSPQGSGERNMWGTKRKIAPVAF